MKALLLAAGYATRLYPLTLDKPKALLNIGSQPMIDYIIEKIKRVREIDEILVVTNHKFYGCFQDWANRQTDKPTNRLTIIDDGTLSNDDRLGAIGDIEFAIRQKDIEEDLLVVGGDNIFETALIDFVEFATSKKPASCIALYDLADKKLATKYGVVSIDAKGRVTDFQEKPAQPKSSFISTCIYYFPLEKLKKFGEYLSDGSVSKDASGNYIKWLSKNDSVYGYVVSGKWYDIGDLESYQKADKDFKR